MHHKRKPLVFHRKCENIQCGNYYNAMYKDANGLCKPCNVKLKRDSEDSLLHDQDEREKI